MSDTAVNQTAAPFVPRDLLPTPPQTEDMIAIPRDLLKYFEVYKAMVDDMLVDLDTNETVCKNGVVFIPLTDLEGAPTEIKSRVIDLLALLYRYYDPVTEKLTFEVHANCETTKWPEDLKAYVNSYKAISEPPYGETLASFMCDLVEHANLALVFKGAYYSLTADILNSLPSNDQRLKDYIAERHITAELLRQKYQSPKIFATIEKRYKDQEAEKTKDNQSASK